MSSVGLDFLLGGQHIKQRCANWGAITQTLPPLRLRQGGSGEDCPLVFVCAASREAALVCSGICEKANPMVLHVQLASQKCPSAHVGHGGRHGAVLGQPREDSEHGKPLFQPTRVYFQ